MKITSNQIQHLYEQLINEKRKKLGGLTPSDPKLKKQKQEQEEMEAIEKNQLVVQKMDKQLKQVNFKVDFKI